MPNCIEAVRLTEARIVEAEGGQVLLPETASPRDALATALGLTMSGARATAFLASEEVPGVEDLLIFAVRRHLPVVIHVSGAAGRPMGVPAAQIFTLYAANPQEAVDFALVARRAAELALLPGTVIVDGWEGEVEVPSDPLVHTFLGSASAEIPAPTPAQRLLFGETRRRLPRWHDGDRPVLHGAKQDRHTRALTLASQSVFFDRHLSDLLTATFGRLAKHTGRRYDVVSCYRLRDARLVVVTQGSAIATAEQVADRVREARKLKVGVLGIRCAHPFPSERIVEQLRGKRAVVVLESSDATVDAPVSLSGRLRMCLERAIDTYRHGGNAYPAYPRMRDKELPKLYSLTFGLGDLPLQAADLEAWCMEFKEKSQPSRYLGIEFLQLTSNHPKRQALQDVLRREYAELRELGLRASTTTAQPALPTGKETPDGEVPLAARSLGVTDNTYDSLPRFWDQVGVLYQHGDIAELTPDPYLATALVPPLSSVLRELSSDRKMLPNFDPTLCTGCGRCWSACPDSAIGTVAINTQALIEAGIRMTGSDALRAAVPALTTYVNNLAKLVDAPKTADQLLQEAFAGLRPSLPSSRREPLERALEVVRNKLGALPLASTDAFFHEPENRRKNSGEWLSLVVDPTACKGCGLCVAECASGALTKVSQTPALLEKARRLWLVWERLPDTPGTTIERARKDSRISPLGTVLLSRHCAQALAGGDDAEPGSGPRLALRLVLAIAEFIQQPRLQSFIEKTGTTRREIAQSIRETLAKALPDQDLDALAEGLDELHDGTVELSRLTDQVQPAVEHAQVDAARLRRLVALAQEMEDLHWRLAEGPQKLGRARLTLALAHGPVAEWATAWPNNPFAVPVAAGTTPQLARGLILGQLQQAGAGFALSRRARLELDKPTEAAHAHSAAEPLDWHNLTPEERAFCPKFLFVGDDRVLIEQSLGAILQILSGDLPIKILVLADPSSETEATVELGLTALVQRHPYVSQTSVAEPEHFFSSVCAAFDYPGPALIHVHAPSPREHGLEPDQTLEHARRMLTDHRFPLFRYDPASDGVFGTRIDLEGNPNGSASDDHPLSWRVLQELAGSVTPFTAEVERTVKEQVASAHAAELEALTDKYETRLRALREEFERDLAARIRSNLLTLTGYQGEARFLRRQTIGDAEHLGKT